MGYVGGRVGCRPGNRGDSGSSDRRGSPEARRDPDLHDPGRRAAELRRSPRGHLCDLAGDGALLQRADPDQPGKPVIDHRLRLRSVHGDAAADRRRQDLYVQDPRRGQVPRRLAADRGRCGGELGAYYPPAQRRAEPAPELVRDGRQGRGPRPDDGRLSSPKFATNAFLPALADPFTFIYRKRNPRPRSALVRKECPWLWPVQICRIRDRPVDQGGTKP